MLACGTAVCIINFSKADFHSSIGFFFKYFLMTEAIFLFLQ